MNLLILTCSVTPQTQPDLKVSSPDIRLMDYVAALTLWTQSTKGSDTEIWVLENTNSISALRSAFLETQRDSPRVRFIQIPFDSLSQTYGKSAGEFEMLKMVAREIRKRNFQRITKVTGRLFVKNFKRCLALSPSFDLACGRFYSPSHILDSRFFCVKPEVYEMIFNREVNFSSRLEKLKVFEGNTYLSMEHYLTHCAFQLESLGFSVESFSKAPLYMGQSASTGKRLNSTRVNLKIRVSNLVRKVAIKFLSGYTP